MAGWVRGVVCISAPFNGAPLLTHPHFGGVPMPALRNSLHGRHARSTLAVTPVMPTAVDGSSEACDQPLLDVGIAFSADPGSRSPWLALATQSPHSLTTRSPHSLTTRCPPLAALVPLLCSLCLLPCALCPLPTTLYLLPSTCYHPPLWVF